MPECPCFHLPSDPAHSCSHQILGGSSRAPGVLYLVGSLSTEKKHTLLQPHCYSQAANRTLSTSLAPDSQRWIICSRIAEEFGHSLLHPHEARRSVFKCLKSRICFLSAGDQASFCQQLLSAAIAFVKRRQFQALQEGSGSSRSRNPF